MKKLSIAPNKFYRNTAKNYNADIFNNKTNEFQLLSISKDVVKEFCLTNKAAEMDQTPSKFLKEAPNVLAYPRSKIVYYSFARRM